MKYTDDRSDYTDDRIFANFRAMEGGSLKENHLFRSASPVNNSHGRALFAVRALGECAVTFVLDLADNAEKLEGYRQEYGFDTYYESLLEDGRVALLGMDANYTGEAYRTALAAGLRQYLQYGGKMLIHCTEGKDRTGFVCALLEALAGATAEEMERDYMITYDNYFGINRETDPKKYDAVVELRLEDILAVIGGEHGTDYAAGARAYLLSGGMTDSEVDALVTEITAP